MKIINILMILLFTVTPALIFPSFSIAQENMVISLDQAVKTALENNRSLRKTALHVASSKLLVQSQRAEFSIKVKPVTRAGYHSSSEEYFSGGLEFSQKSSVGISGTITPELQKTGGSYKSSVTVGLNIPLLKGFGTDSTLDGLNSSLYDFENSRRSFYQHQVNIVLDTVSTIYKIIKNQQQGQLLTSQVSLLQNHLFVTRMKEKARLSSSMDLYRAELRLKEVQNEMTALQEQLDNLNDELKDLLAMPLQGHLIVEAPIEYNPVDTRIDQAIEIALKNRIELEQAQRFVEESQRKYLLAKKNILPRLDLKLGYEKFGDNKSFDLDEENITVSLQSSSDLLLKNEKRTFEQANIRLKQAKIDLQSQRQKVIRDVRSQVFHMRKKKKLIQDRKEQASQAQGKMELASSKFNHGLADNFNLIEAQSQAQRVRSLLLLDTIDYIVSVYKLRAQLGTLIDRKVIQ